MNNLFGQQILFKNYSVEDGLCSNTVWCIAQDDQGYMWFGTKNGLSRFDGYRFKSYQFNKQKPGSLGDNFIHDICRYDTKNLWVATERGVYILNLETDEFTHFAPLADKLTYDIHRDKRGIVWIGTHSAGLYRYDPQNGQIRQFTASHTDTSPSANQIRKITEDKSGNIWLGAYGGGVDMLNPLSLKFKHYTATNSNLSNNSILTLYADNEDNIWIGTVQGGLNVWRKDSGTIKTYKKSGPGTIKDNIVRAIYQPGPGKLYVGTEKGLGVLNLATDQFVSYEKQSSDIFSISDNAVYSICPDREGNVWVGTFFGGVDYFRNDGYSFELYYPKAQANSISGSAVSCFLEDEPGKFWIGTEDGGLNYFNTVTGKFKHYPFSPGQDELSYHNIHSLFKDNAGNIWIGTFTGGLNIYNPKTGKIKRYKNISGDSTSLSSNIIYSIYQDKDNTIWVGTVYGLNIYNPQTDSFIRINDMGLDSGYIYDIYEDNVHNIWFATYNYGLFVKNKRSGKWRHYMADGKTHSLSSDRLTCMLDDHAGNLWIGTDGGGLNRFSLKDRTVKVYGSQEGIDANVIYGILQDDNGNLWISTNNSIYKLDLRTGKAKHYNGWNSIQSKQFNYTAYYKASDGKLYFGGIKGFNAFYPDSIANNYGKTQVTLTNFQLFNQDVNVDSIEGPLTKPISFAKNIVLAYDQSVISFEYAALSYIAPQKTHYAYMMEGFDKNWNYVGNQRKATYTNLPPGSYTFKVKATGDKDNWNVPETSIRLTVKPPFYRTDLAYIIYLLLIIGSVIGLRRYIINQARKKNQIKLERLKNKREQEFYTQKIEFFTAMAHEVRTPLSLIIAPLEKLLNSNKWEPQEQEQLRIMDENSSRLLNLVNQLLDFRRIESDIYTLHTENIELVSFVHAIYSRFSAIPYQKGLKFTLSTKISRLMVQADPEALTKILNNLLINAFKFTRTKVRISINEPEKDESGQVYFSVSIEDDGIGIPASEIDNIFKKFFKVSEGEHHYTNLGGTGIGLSLAKSLTEKHNGRLEVSSTEGVSTTFNVLIPYTDENQQENAIVESIDKTGESQVDDADRTTVLVVEDDESLIDFISGTLRNEGYNVLKAGNGREGLSMLENHTVDLVISDVMMPEMDGLEFCKQVKTNINYSHIPLILLTAKGNSDAEIAGIENGADSYIIKPFKWKHVSAVMKNLLESRTLLREKFAQHPFETVNSLGTNSRDKKFMEKIVEIIEERITDPQLSVEELSRDVGMSRSSLHKKLKSLSGHVPNEFIRLIRLKHAARLLLSNEYTISEICYMVGFNSHSYFSKCFYQQFQLTPSEFVEKHQVPQ
ncbi:hybrid sensor histidine kinase/response regulator transcription factor [Pedobacter sp. BS3]|uniref:hybrid sensor histidine kinase/response regulator transcription factor n=1 Tax=Pedobacter sp. BS3 TaxID=2567937 RepID=UPI001659AA81|nr:hybrid sensor histidine kinase/response regulator transcription factor [Pedobacter sp. BS3]